MCLLRQPCKTYKLSLWGNVFEIEITVLNGNLHDIQNFTAYFGFCHKEYLVK